MNLEASTSRIPEAVPGTSNANVSTDSQIAQAGTSTSSVAGCSKSLPVVQKDNEKTRKLYLIVYKFLQQQLNENPSLDDMQKESLEVIVNCLGYAFQFFEFDYVEHTLPKIYEFFEKHKHESKKKHVRVLALLFSKF